MSTALHRPAVVIAVGGVLLALALLATLSVGVIRTPLSEVLQALVGRASDAAVGSMTRTLVLDMRLPRGVAAICVGVSLGAAGCMLQALLRDPLASPTIIGTAQASGFGRVLGVFLGLPYAGSIGLAFLMALVGTLIVLVVARSRRGFPSHVVLLTGVSVGMLFMALIGLVQYTSKDEGQLSRMVLMMLGGLWQVSWEPLRLIAPLTIVGIAAAALLGRRLDLFALGEESADRLGLGTNVSGTAILVLACLLTSIAVSIAGVIAFVGLIVPHVARGLVGPAHAALLPASALMGALLLLLVDAVARTAVAPNELPLGVLTSLVGVPFFLVLLRSMARRGAPR